MSEFSRVTTKAVGEWWHGARVGVLIQLKAEQPNVRCARGYLNRALLELWGDEYAVNVCVVVVRRIPIFGPLNEGLELV